MEIERQRYSESELMEQIRWIEYCEDSTKCNLLEYNITIEEYTEHKVVNMMFDNISEHCLIEEDEWKVMFNNILIVVDFEHNKLYLKYFKDRIILTDINYIIKLFAFLSPKYVNTNIDL